MKTFPISIVLVSSLVITPDIRGATGDLDLSFDAGSTLNGPAYGIALQPDGKILVGGEFTTVAGGLRRRVARLNPDGTGDSSFDPRAGANGLVRSIVLQPDGKVLVGGWFTEMNGVSRNRVARLNADGSLDAGFNPGSGADDRVFGVGLQPDGKVLVAGYFTHMNGTPRNYIARLNPDGTLDSSFNPGLGPDYYVVSVVLQPDGKVIISGWFTLVNGVIRSGIARLNSDGTLDPSFNPGTGVDYLSQPGVISTVLQPDGKILIGGFFFNVNRTARHSVARLNPDGSLDASFDPGQGPNAFIQSMALQADGKVVLGGQFTAFNGTNRRLLVRLNRDGTIDTSYNPEVGQYPPGVAVVTLQPDGKALVGGWINSVGSRIRNFLARVNADGSEDATFNPSTGIGGYHVGSVAVQPDGKVLIGGFFTDFNGVSRRSIARLDGQGKLDLSFDPGMITGTTVIFTPPVPVIYSLALQPDGKVIIGGGFTNINGHSRNCIARLNADGSLDTDFNPGTGADYNVYRVVPQADGKVLITGGFLTVNGVARDSFARLNSDGSLDFGFNPSLSNGFPSAIASQPDGRILIGGYESVNHVLRYFVRRLHADGSLDATFDTGAGPNRFVSSLAVQSDGKVLVGGEFTSFNGVNRTNLIRLNADGGLDSSFNPVGGTNVFGAVRFVQLDGRVLVSRSFTNWDGTIRGGLARLYADGSLDQSFNLVAADERGGGIFSVALSPDSRLVLGGGFSSIDGVPRAFVARLFGDAPIVTTQPSSRTNVVGTTATFTAVASGLPPLSYQWYKDGVPLTDSGRISGITTSTVTLNHVQFRDTGSYTVTVSNWDGSVSSNPALLSIVVPRTVRTE